MTALFSSMSLLLLLLLLLLLSSSSSSSLSQMKSLFSSLSHIGSDCPMVLVMLETNQCLIFICHILLQIDDPIVLVILETNQSISCLILISFKRLVCPASSVVVTMNYLEFQGWINQAGYFLFISLTHNANPWCGSLSSIPCCLSLK